MAHTSWVSLETAIPREVPTKEHRLNLYKVWKHKFRHSERRGRGHRGRGRWQKQGWKEGCREKSGTLSSTHCVQDLRYSAGFKGINTSKRSSLHTLNMQRLLKLVIIQYIYFKVQKLKSQALSNVEQNLHISIRLPFHIH